MGLSSLLQFGLVHWHRAWGLGLLGLDAASTNPAYALWFYWGFRGAFGASLVVGALGFWTLTAPEPHSTSRKD
ncbi:MAG: hypothetical protein M1272_08590 [Firmicutes bacterium]|nr:hypothetical protein [Bacillota bacterium]